MKSQLQKYQKMKWLWCGGVPDNFDKQPENHQHPKNFTIL